MIFSILFTIFGSTISGLAKLLGLISFGQYGQGFLDGLEYFGNNCMKLNHFFPIYEFLQVIDFLLVFISGYYFVVLLVSLFNWIRGAGAIKV